MNNHCNKNKFHKILIILCCAIPLLVIGALYFTKVQGTSWGSILSFGAILLCPLMHLIMMPLMHGKRGESTEDNKQSCH
jgi:hypothetical protein